MKPITHGKDYNFFQKVTINGSAFPEDSDITFNFKGIQSLSIVNEGSAVVEYSFNGNALHGDLTPGGPTEAIFFDNRVVSAIWFRTDTPGQIIRVEAWGHR